MSDAVAKATDWLRDELASDMEEMEARSPTEWVRVCVDTVLMLGLVFRAAVYSCTYAINYAEKGAEISFRVDERPLSAEPWGAGDELQASTLTVIVAALIAQYSSPPASPAVLVVVASVAIVLALDVGQAVTEVIQ